jgi:tetratricopeptide (TPR) repeat protein
VDQQAFEAAKAAYQQGDWSRAASSLEGVTEPGEVSGAVDHLKGNALMKLGRYADAAAAYGEALRDAAYGKTGALSCNKGRAELAAGQLDAAVASLTAATQDSTYPTPYKAYLALGNAQVKRGDVRAAGVAFRNAAIDESNPSPATALTKLGKCFMDMGRPVDAVEAYRTALDFSTPAGSQNAIYSDLGKAYVAANRMPEAVDAFDHATSDGSYQLGAQAEAAYHAAQKAVAALANRKPSETDAFLQAAGYGMEGVDPLDPTGASGAFMPSPEDTGFFSVDEKELVRQEKNERRVQRKKRHPFVKALLIVVVIAIVIGGAGVFAYYRGYGWPTQQSVAEQLFKDATSGDISPELASGISADAKSSIESVLPSGASAKVEGIDQSMTASKVLVSATLSGGGSQTYTISMVREGIGWKVSNVTVTYPSQGGSTTTVSTGTVATSAAATSTAATS